MTRVTFDAAILARFPNLTSLVEICDESGRTLGYFQPVEQRGESGQAGRPPTEIKEIHQIAVLHDLAEAIIESIHQKWNNDGKGRPLDEMGIDKANLKIDDASVFRSLYEVLTKLRTRLQFGYRLFGDEDLAIHARALSIFLGEFEGNSPWAKQKPKEEEGKEGE